MKRYTFTRHCDYEPADGRPRHYEPGEQFTQAALRRVIPLSVITEWLELEALQQEDGDNG